MFVILENKPSVIRAQTLEKDRTVGAQQMRAQKKKPRTIRLDCAGLSSSYKASN